jgi:hypothetical protein
MATAYVALLSAQVRTTMTSACNWLLEATVCCLEGVHNHHAFIKHDELAIVPFSKMSASNFLNRMKM